MTQRGIASALGISRAAYARVESGARELRISEAEKLAAVFGMSLESFLAEKEPERSAAAGEEPGIRVAKKNPEKLREILLYVLGEAGAKPNVGEAALHRLLYFIDFDYYEMFEENLMGADYVRNRRGPSCIELASTISEMEKREEIEAVESRHFEHGQRKYLPLRRPDLDLLSAREICHVDGVLARLSDKNAREMENHSRGDIPWRVTREGEPISYESVFYRDEKYSARNYDDEI